MRQTSEVNDTDFPFAEDTTAFILVVPGGDGENYTKDARGFEHASTFDKKRALVEQALAINADGAPCSLLAVWPGGNRSDVFLVDDLNEALAAF